MEAGASGRLYQLAPRYVEVTVQRSLQRRAVFELTAKYRRLHSPGRARALHQGASGASAYAEHQRDPQNAFVAESHLEAGAAVDRSDQRDKAVGGEQDMANMLPGPAQHIAKAQLNLLAACQQMLTIRAG